VKERGMQKGFGLMEKYLGEKMVRSMGNLKECEMEKMKGIEKVRKLKGIYSGSYLEMRTVRWKDERKGRH
jgi:hypothetical protein